MENPNAKVLKRERYDDSNLGSLDRILYDDMSGSIYGGNVFRFEPSNEKYHNELIDSTFQGELPKVKVLVKDGTRQINKEAKGFQESLGYSKKYHVDIFEASKRLGYDIHCYEYPTLEMIKEEDKEALDNALHPMSIRLLGLEASLKFQRQEAKKELEGITIDLIKAENIKKRVLEEKYSKVTIKLEYIEELIEQSRVAVALYKDEDQEVSTAAGLLFDKLEGFNSYYNKDRAIYMGNVNNQYFDIIPEKSSYFYGQLFHGLDMDIEEWFNPYEHTFNDSFHRYYKDAGDNLIDDTFPMDGATVKYKDYSAFLKMFILITNYSSFTKKKLLNLVDYKNEHLVTLDQDNFLRKVEELMQDQELQQLQKTKENLQEKQKEFISQYRHPQKFLSEIEGIYIDAKEGTLNPRLAVFPHQFEGREFLVDIIAKMKSKLFNLTQEDSFYTDHKGELAGDKARSRIKAISWNAVKKLRKEYPKMILLRDSKGKPIDINTASKEELRNLPFAFNNKILTSILAERPFDSIVKISKQCPSITPVVVNLWRSKNVVFLTDIIKEYQQINKSKDPDKKELSKLYAKVKSAGLPPYDIKIVEEILNWSI